MFRLQHIEYLPALAAVPLVIFLFYWLLRWKTGVVQKIGEVALVKQLIGSFSSPKFIIKFAIAMLALVATILGLSNLQKKGSTENVNRQGVDIMLVMDVSKSMLAEDYKGRRLAKAKQLLSGLLDKFENDRVGLVLFAGRAYMQMPLTTDQSAAKMYIQDAGPNVVPTQGTVIADALRMANGAFNENDHQYKTVVLVSDGEDHDPDALKTAKQLADMGVMINTVGIGTPEGAPITDPNTHELKKDENGHIVISKLNETELTQLSDVSNGIYIRLTNIDDALITLTQRIDGIQKRSLTDKEFVNYESYFQWFLGAALLLLLMEFLLSERKLRLV